MPVIPIRLILRKFITFFRVAARVTVLRLVAVGAWISEGLATTGAGRSAANSIARGRDCGRSERARLLPSGRVLGRTGEGRLAGRVMGRNAAKGFVSSGDAVSGGRGATSDRSAPALL